MKAFMITLIGLFFATAVMAQSNSQAVELKQDGPKLSFEESTHDFGDIQQGDVVEHVFSFKNTGNKPLVLANVKTTCGCTAPSWPREPIAPGADGKITVKFNSAHKLGRQHKVVTITSNAVNNPAQISITTNVLKGNSES